jgi:hypothetical protein
LYFQNNFQSFIDVFAIVVLTSFLFSTAIVLFSAPSSNCLFLRALLMTLHRQPNCHMGKTLNLVGLLTLLSLSLSAQQMDSTLDKIAGFPNRLFSHVQSKSASLSQQLNKQTAKFLARLSRKEARLKKQLYKQDSAAAAKLFATNPQQQYAALSNKLQNDSATVMHSMGAQYLPYVDSVGVSLSFLNKNPQLLSSVGPLPPGFTNSLTQLQQLESKMQDADQIKQIVQARKAQLLQYLTQNTNLPPGIKNLYQNYNSEVYYYSERVREYREMLNNPDQMIQTALSLLNKLPAFTSFMRKNSFLAGLFSVTPDYGMPQGLEGLQTRDQVLNMIKGKIGQGGPNAASSIQQSIQTAQQSITKLQNKLSALGAGSGDMDMPDFKPNQQKTKTFLKRLQYGIDFQTLQGSNFYPSTTDVGLTIAYKLGNKNTIGLRGSYKFGWGNGFQDISFSSQGASIGSYVDIQMKKSFYLSGAYELNYQQPFSTFGQISGLNDWSQSGLIGVSKIIHLKTKFFKQTKVSILWDFLSYYQIPQTEPFKFRVGYNF